MSNNPVQPAECGFGARLSRVVAARGPLCAGIDPHPELLRDWGLGDDVAGLERFARDAVEALAPEVALVKPQSAFFERHGARGIRVLEQVLVAARDAGALVLLDVKRGDIGSTMAGYAAAYLSDGAPLAADAITVSPYLGVGALDPAFELAGRTGRGVFVLALTSNPEGADVQAAVTGVGSTGIGSTGAGSTVVGSTVVGSTVAQSVVDAVAARNAGHVGDFGVVVGATAAARALRFEALNGPILVPGIGAQGASLVDLPEVFGAAIRHVLPTTSRALLRYGPEPASLRHAARRMADEVADLLTSHL
ncbi:MAG TPA: orotidine-5'-phosphate decarboxylase [Pseudonocardiaceae bacterium]|nr:orotidine-5'-phosphate decarboxylase [Pseudonocardiaceae bacterium]